MKKYCRVQVTLYDSLDHEVTTYTAQVHPEIFDEMEFDEDHQAYISDAYVDGELGWREYRKLNNE